MILKSLFASTLILLLAATASSQQPAEAKLFKRYEYSASYHRISEDVLTLKIVVAPAERAKIAIRVCSKEPLPVALTITRANAFRMVELLVGAYSYLPEQIIFVRSEDCLSKDNSTTPVEIWTLTENSSLPRHIEARPSTQIRRSALGKKPVNYGIRDYEAATRELIKKLQANPGSRGVVIGYFFKRPSVTLKRSLRIVNALFQRSGLPPERYVIHTTHWIDEFSYSDPEPPYPFVFLVEEGVFIDGASAR